MRDEDVRAACMAHLSVLVAEFGEDVPYVGGLARGFPFRGARESDSTRPASAAELSPRMQPSARFVS